MSAPYQFVDADKDIAGVELIQDKAQGSVLWLQTSPNGCYIPVDRLPEFIAGLQHIAENKADAAAGAE